MTAETESKSEEKFEEKPEEKSEEKLNDESSESEKKEENKDEVSSDSTEVEAKVEVGSEIYEELAAIVGRDRVSESNLDRILYSHDLAPLPKEMGLMFKTVPDVVVKPRSAEDLSKIMKKAQKENIPVTPRGGASWAMGGAVPAFGGILVDMGSMQEILEINKDNLYVIVESGVNWKSLYDKLLAKGLFIGAYPSSAPGASVGGWINTGGVGIGSYKYGGIEKQIRQLEVVLPDGSIITTGNRNVVNNSSGYNLTDLFAGSEGTLGIITKITLKLYPAPEEIRPVSFEFSTLEEAADSIKILTRSNITPYHISFLDGAHFELLREMGKKAPEVGAMVNIAFSGNTEIIDIEEKITSVIMPKQGGKKMSEKIAKHEWEERMFEARARKLGPGFLLGEGFCPVSKFSEMATNSKKVLNKLKMKGAVVGTVCDINTATFMTYAIPNEHKLIKSLASMSIVKKLTDEVIKVGGRPGGFGLLFSGNLKKIHGKSVFAMDNIKNAFDPHYIMNPGKLTENVTRFGMPVPALAFNMGMDAMAIFKRMLPTDKKKKGSNR
jgi:glycolate oxidase